MCGADSGCGQRTTDRGYALVGGAYAYELRRGEEILSTGRLMAERELGPGDEVSVAGVVAQVEEVDWVNGESRLILQPVPRLTAS